MARGVKWRAMGNAGRVTFFPRGMLPKRVEMPKLREDVGIESCRSFGHKSLSRGSKCREQQVE